MPSPFPGMNPYLESPEIWPGFHGSLIASIRGTINRIAPAKYFADIEQRVFLVKPGDPYQRAIVPDVSINETADASADRSNTSSNVAAQAVTPSIRVQMLDEEVAERFITIRAAAGAGGVDTEIVTIIEVLSPSNKLVGSSGRTSYLAKRDEVLKTRTHFIEIDLLRAGERRPLGPGGYDCDYLVTLSRVEERPVAELWPTNLQAPLPTIPIPLLPGDSDLVINLQQMLHQVYDESGYQRRIRLSDPIPLPPLSDDDQAWLEQLKSN